MCPRLSSLISSVYSSVGAAFSSLGVTWNSVSNAVLSVPACEVLSDSELEQRVVETAEKYIRQWGTYTTPNSRYFQPHNYTKYRGKSDYARDVTFNWVLNFCDEFYRSAQKAKTSGHRYGCALASPSFENQEDYARLYPCIPEILALYGLKVRYQGSGYYPSFQVLDHSRCSFTHLFPAVRREMDSADREYTYPKVTFEGYDGHNCMGVRLPVIRYASSNQ